MCVYVFTTKLCGNSLVQSDALIFAWLLIESIVLALKIREKRSQEKVYYNLSYIFTLSSWEGECKNCTSMLKYHTAIFRRVAKYWLHRLSHEPKLAQLHTSIAVTHDSTNSVIMMAACGSTMQSIFQWNKYPNYLYSVVVQCSYNMQSGLVAMELQGRIMWSGFSRNPSTRYVCWHDEAIRQKERFFPSNTTHVYATTDWVARTHAKMTCEHFLLSIVLTAHTFTGPGES